MQQGFPENITIKVVYASTHPNIKIERVNDLAKRVES